MLSSRQRQNPQQRSPAPPTAFPVGLQPVGSEDAPTRKLSKRGSRSQLDFEEALQSGGTVQIKEGLDINMLGNISIGSPTPTESSRSPRLPSNQPRTPTVLPPTPDVSMELDPVNRRSMYRSPGTASSPDLATLLRKQKEKNKQTQPSQGLDRERGYPSTPITPTSKHGKSPHRSGDPVSEWVLTSPSVASGLHKPMKTSVRAKTSAFLGKMLGQSTVRERSKTDAANPSPQRLSDAFIPPVPQLSPEHQRTRQVSPIADVFSTPLNSSVSTSSTMKPLPTPLELTSPDPSSSRPRTPSPVGMANKMSSSMKRRSMSVSDLDLKKVMETAAAHEDTPPPRPPKSPRHAPPDARMKAVISDFHGVLSQLEHDPFSADTRLDLRDPSTPARRAGYQRAKTDGVLSSSTTSSFDKSPRSPIRPMSLMTPPTLSVPIAERPGSSPGPPPSGIPRMQQPPLRNGLSNPALSARLQAHEQLTQQATPILNSPPQNRRDSSRLRIQHRSTASSSEPSLIGITGPNEDRGLTFRASIHDLGANSSPTRFPSMRKSLSAEQEAEEGKRAAERCWQEDEEFLAKEKIAEWLGGIGRINKLALPHYINNFDFTDLRLDVAFRTLCAKLYLKAETQQVDRILEEFSRRFWECNPTSVYGSANIVHAVSYSLLLLNTDLHVADLVSRMSKSQFVKNTLTAIQMQLQSDEPTSPSDGASNDDDSDFMRGSGSDYAATSQQTSPSKTQSKRSDSITSWNSVPRDVFIPSLTATSPGGPTNGSSPSVQISLASPDTKSSSGGVMSRAREIELENNLKDMYTAVKNQQILQPLTMSRLSNSSLSPLPPSVIARNRSLRTGHPDRLMTLKRGSIRGLQSIMGTSQAGSSPYSSQSSMDGRVSPSPSYATSTNDFYASSSSFLPPTLGFASNLSHTIIRETQEDDTGSVHSANSGSTTISITDEELALLGAPWAKEGMLSKKQYWEATSKRAKDKRWMDVFVVIQKGELSMFIFGEQSAGGSGAMGGGNWLSNAQPVGTLHLAHSLAHVLPPPGYRQRPHCMVLTLSSGAVYFFQAGTEELVNEWVSTCNYWAARTSKEPLAGGVSNMEYGWNRVLDATASPSPHGKSYSDTESVVDYTDTMSVKSGKSNRSRFGGGAGMAATIRGSTSPYSDKVFINDWKAPMPPTVSSVHDEESQLDALKKHVFSMKKDLKRHNELREPMASFYNSRSAVALKAQNNWGKKSQWLLTEIVKYESYIDSLQAAMSLRLKKRGEKALEQALDGNASAAKKGKWRADEETIHEEEDGESTAPRAHRRELAEDENNTLNGGDEYEDDDDATTL